MEKREFWQDFKNFKDAYINFKEILKQGITISEIANRYNTTVEKINSILVRFDEVMDPIIYKAIMEHYSQFTIDDNKAIIISDTHIGSYKEYLKLFDTIFNYASKYGYKSIIHAGDIIEGNTHPPHRKYDVNNQIKNLFDIFNQEGIPKMYYLYGNHDYNLEVNDSILLNERLKELKNLIYIGRGNSYVQLNDKDFIKIEHYLSYNETYIPKIQTNLKLEGHHHGYRFYDNNVVYLPPLSLVSGEANLGFVTLSTTGNEFILDVYKELKNNKINYYEQKIIKKYL